MLRSWSRGNYFRVGGENQINIEWGWNIIGRRLIFRLGKLEELYATIILAFYACFSFGLNFCY